MRGTGREVHHTRATRLRTGLQCGLGGPMGVAVAQPPVRRQPSLRRGPALADECDRGRGASSCWKSACSMLSCSAVSERTKEAALCVHGLECTRACSLCTVHTRWCTCGDTEIKIQTTHMHIDIWTCTAVHTRAVYLHVRQVVGGLRDELRRVAEARDVLQVGVELRGARLQHKEHMRECVRHNSAQACTIQSRACSSTNMSTGKNSSAPCEPALVTEREELMRLQQFSTHTSLSRGVRYAAWVAKSGGTLH